MFTTLKSPVVVSRITCCCMVEVCIGVPDRNDSGSAYNGPQKHALFAESNAEYNLTNFALRRWGAAKELKLQSPIDPQNTLERSAKVSGLSKFNLASRIILPPRFPSVYQGTRADVVRGTGGRISTSQRDECCRCTEATRRRCS